MNLKPALKEKILKAQLNEITEYYIYTQLAKTIKAKKNQEVLKTIGKEELAHYNFWKNLTKQEVKPSNLKINLYYFISKTFGLNFGIRLMELGEESAQSFYKQFEKVDPKVKQIIKDEDEHEQELLELLDKEQLKFTGSIVLGLNDALVELTGALAGFTLALQKTKLVAVAGLITGIAASLSMAASEYLSVKEEGGQDYLKASLSTGIAYIFTVFFLILPYFLFQNPFICLTLTLSFALIIILIFNFYISVAKGISFKKKFSEMAGISLGVAGLNFFIGLLVKKYLKLEV